MVSVGGILESPSFRWSIWMMWSRPSIWETMLLCDRRDIRPIVEYLGRRGMATVQAVRDEMYLRGTGLDARTCRDSWRFFHRIGRLASYAGPVLWLALWDEVERSRT